MKKIITFTISLALALLIIGLSLGYYYLKSDSNSLDEPELMNTPDKSISEQVQEPEIFQLAEESCELTFTLAAATTPPATPIPGCYGACTIDADGQDNCPENLICSNISGVNKCVNNSCPASTNCVCPTPTPTPTPAPTPKPGCYGTCSGDYDCPTGLACRTINGVNKCVNLSCAGASNCQCDTTQPSAPSVPSEPSTSTTPELPKAGGVPPTIIFAMGGIVIVLLGLIF